jgi:hypothetical protein
VFESSTALALFDYFRVPYRQAGETDPLGLEWVRAGSASLLWPGEGLLGKTRPAPYIVGSVPVFARLVPEGRVSQAVRGLPGSWRLDEPVRDSGGRVVGGLWRSDDGSALLPFDPSEALTSFWTESYAEVGGRGRANRIASVVREVYYRARPFLPRDVQLRLRRTFSRVQRKSRFPRWPVETAVDDLFRLLFRVVGEVAGEPVPYVAAWPGESSWALVLTHDVERRVGYDGVDLLRDIELEEGYRSSWNFVPCNGYVVERALLEQLRDEGFEIGVHGLFHDGRDLLPRTLPRRLPAIRAYAEHWQAVGFRSPATIRSPRLIPLLGFDYDSSYADTAPFEPQAGGCCTWLPYHLGGTVELPITLEQDHTLFDLLGHQDETLWVEKARIIRERGGMALMITHPDYAGNPNLRSAYQGFLREFADDATAWKALPRDVADWWRRRAESKLERDGDGWRIVGPAAGEARVEFFAADPVAELSGYRASGSST